MLDINKIYQGHTPEVLKSFPDDSIDCVITSPPYWALRDYKLEPQKFEDGWEGQLGLEPTFKLYLKHLMQIFDEVKRVLKPTGTCWVNIGDSYSATRWSNSPSTSFNPKCADVLIEKKINLPPKTLCAIPERFKIMMIDRGWICRNTIIWHKRNCLNGGTILYAKTQKGVMPSTIKDLTRLKPETVQLWDGERWQRVKEWIKNNNPQDIKEITFRNGETINCTGDHLFPLENGAIKKANELRVGDIVKKTQFPPKQKTVEYIPDEMGWFIGTYLADGSLGDKGRCLQFSSHIKEQDRFEKLKKIAVQYDSECYSFSKGGNTTTFNIYSKVLVAIIKTYVAGNNAKNKHLTNAVWQRGYQFLLPLFLGYLQGDGYWEEKNQRYRLCFCRNRYLARDLRVLSARLGYRIKLQRGVVTLKGKQFKKFYGEVRTTQSSHWNNKSDSQIIEIKRGKKNGNYWDIVLEKEPHLFATHSGILVHNCMPSSASDRFTVDYEPVHFFVKNQKYWFEQQFEPNMDSYNGERGNNLTRKKMQSAMRTKSDKDYYGLGRNKRCVWDVTTQPYSEAHFATFPEALVEPMIRSGCPEFICKKCGGVREKIWKKGELIHTGNNWSTTYNPVKEDPTGMSMATCLNKAGWKPGHQREQKFLGYSDCGCNGGWKAGIVLDPFMGSGTVAKVAKKLKRNWIGIELSEKYIELANKRIKNVQMELF